MLHHPFKPVLSLLFCALSAASSMAADRPPYPTDKITLVVPYSPGNGLDLLGREFAEALRQQMHVPVIVENRDGAAGVIGTQYVARAKPDGYTLLFTANPPFITSPLAMEKPSYDPVNAFTPIARVASAPLVLVVGTKYPIRNVAQLRDFAAKNPALASYASAGIGSPGQIYGELLNQSIGVQLQEIRYKATGQALMDVVAGNVLASLVSVSAALPHIKSGALTALAVGSKERLPALADVPTLAESLQSQDFEASVWYGVLAPAGTSEERVAAIYEEVARATNGKHIRAFMERQFMVPAVIDSAGFARSMKTELQVSKKLVDQANLRAR